MKKVYVVFDEDCCGLNEIVKVFEMEVDALEFDNINKSKFYSIKEVEYVESGSKELGDKIG